MTIEAWPDVLKARIWDPHLRNLAAAGGMTPTGRTQRVFSDAGLWEIKISNIVVRNRQHAAAFRALIARLRAGEDILLPVRDCYPPIGNRISNAAASFVGGAALRATQVTLNIAGVAVEAGHHLSVGDRLHLVTEVVSGPSMPPLLNQLVSRSPWSSSVPWSNAVAGSADYALKILPPLRAAQGSGVAARFRDLRLRCVLKDTADGDLDLDLGRFGAPSLTFIESL